jgi:hypothetical protein
MAQLNSPYMRQGLFPFMRQGLFPLLSNAPGKRYVELGGGSHTIMVEKNRLELFKAVQSFLDDTEVK